MTTIRLPTPLRSTVGGASTISVSAPTLGELPAEISAKYPDLGARILRDGAFGSFVTVFIDGEDTRFLEPSTPLDKVKLIEVLPAMSGGMR